MWGSERTILIYEENTMARVAKKAQLACSHLKHEALTRPDISAGN